jgi:hypothetical protein
MTAMLRQIDPPPSDEDQARLCGNCGYDLRGSTTPRCSECGAAFDPAETLTFANIPWFHRRSIGTCRAIWRTVWFVLMQRLADEAKRRTRLDLLAAESFRKLCIGVAAGSIALAVAVPVSYAPLMIWLFIVVTVPLLMLFHWLTLPLDTPHGPSSIRAKRRATLQHFATAPLLLMPAVVITAAGSRLIGAAPPIPTALSGMVIMAIWIASVLNFHLRAGVYGFGLILRDLIIPALILALGAGLTFAVLVAGTALSTRLIDW